MGRDNFQRGTRHREDVSLCLVFDLVEARKRRGWTMARLAREMGVSYQRVQQLEGNWSCNVDTLVRWAAALDYKLELNR